MMTDLWSSNTPARFWLCRQEDTSPRWKEAVAEALPVLGMPVPSSDLDRILALTLGEGQFGPNRWRLGPARRLYYLVKPLVPRTLSRLLRRMQAGPAGADFPLDWPTEERYCHFQWEVMRQLLIATGQQSLAFRRFWPEGHRYAFVLTHDVETKEGQAYVGAVAELEESFGFRSSFNFVPERYPLDHELMEDLRTRGFEIGVHGLRHDGKLFRSKAEFTRRAERINVYLKQLEAVGFRAPLMMRNPEWMQSLQIEYDLSFFDTDPYEPMPGGTMSIWPFILGRFAELPYTLMQDCTLTTVLGETTPRLWLEKVDFIERYWGMVLVNTHPDYLSDLGTWKICSDFLEAMRRRDGYWHALPREVARWWRTRAAGTGANADPRLVWGEVALHENGMSLELKDFK